MFAFYSMATKFAYKEEMQQSSTIKSTRNLLASRSTTAPRAARSHRGAETDHEIPQAPL
jgi:hypothetical protein